MGRTRNDVFPLHPLAYHLTEIHPFYPHDQLWEDSKISSKLQDAA